MSEYLNLQYFDYVGIFGAIVILLFFLLNQFNKIRNDNIYYDLGNFIGSMLLVYFAVKTHSLPFIVLNIVWAVVSLKDVLLVFFKK